MSMFNDISYGTRDNEQECLANANLVYLFAKRFGKGQWSFIGPGSEKKWYSIKELMWSQWSSSGISSQDSSHCSSATKFKSYC